MKNFKSFLNEACWTGYKAIGTKKNGGKQVPNCVPVEEDGMGAGAVSAGPTNVTGVQSSTDPVSATARKMTPKKKSTKMFRRSPPKA